MCQLYGEIYAALHAATNDRLFGVLDPRCPHAEADKLVQRNQDPTADGANFARQWKRGTVGQTERAALNCDNWLTPTSSWRPSAADC